MTDDMTGFLLDNFEMIAEAPGGVQRLRELILQLAVTGRLGTGDERDEPVKSHDRAKDLISQTNKDERTKFDNIIVQLVEKVSLPRGWIINDFDSLGKWSTGGTPSRAHFEYYNGEIPWVKSGDLNDGIIKQTNEKITQIGLDNSNAKILPVGTVCVALYGATIGRVGLLGIEASTNQACANCIPNEEIVNTQYLFYYILQQRKNFIEAGQGGAQPNITNGILRNWPIYLPPLAEQQRIVEKVDSLMALCDDLEAKQTQKHTHLVRLGTGSLIALQQSETPGGLVQWWEHLQTNFGLIFDCVENVEALRQTILQLAVTGRLGTGDERDEPACNIVEIIKKTHLTLQKRLKFESNGELDYQDTDYPFPIPESWTWIRFGQIITDLKYGTSQKCGYEIKGTPVLRIPNISNGAVNLNDLKYGLLTDKEISDYSLQEGDFLIIRSNGSVSLVGRAALVSDNLNSFAYAGYLVRARLYKQFLFPKYIQKALNSQFTREQIEIPIRTTSGVKNINSKEISRLLLPLPPLPEQQRIVEKVDSLMALCDQLEQNINHRSNNSISLSNATIQRITGLT